MFVELRRRLPGLLAWMESCYSCQPLLHLGGDCIHSCCGLQQGDPLDPLGFALTLHPIVECIRDEVPDLALNAWYLDDGTLVGSPENLAEVLSIIEKFDPLVSLKLNRNKSVLFIPEESDPSRSLLPSYIPVFRRGFSLLNCPIGLPSFCEEVLQDRIAKLKISLAAMHDMGDAHLEITLLCSCFALPKISFVLCTCPPSYVCEAAKDFDNAMRESLESIVGGPVSEWSWLKASLPSSRGGINLRSVSLHATAAFMGSSSDCRPLVERMLRSPMGSSPHFDSTVTALAMAVSCADWQSLENIDIPLLQRPLSLTVDKALY